MAARQGWWGRGSGAGVRVSGMHEAIYEVPPTLITSRMRMDSRRKPTQGSVHTKQRGTVNGKQTVRRYSTGGNAVGGH